MSRKVKIKQLNKVVGGDAEGINGMFEEMMGMKDADPYIIIPKFVEARNTCRHLYRVLRQLSGFDALRNDFPVILDGLNELHEFTDNFQASVYFSPDHDDEEEKYEELDKEKINSLYRTLKDNEHIKMLIVLCGRLSQYKTYIGDKDNLKDNFIGQEPGITLDIFSTLNCTFDLKLLWYQKSITPMVKQYVLTIIHTVFEDTKKIHKLITSPDVDIDKFSDVLLTAIAKLKKQPGLNRCHNAFKRIESSVELLKNNFDGYYRGSVASSNPNVIMESFIIDVSNQGGADATLTREFRQIIQYMHKVSAQSGKSKDPNVQKLFKILQQNMNVMEEQTDDKDSEPTVELTPEEVSASFDVEQYKASATAKSVGGKKKKKKKKRGKN